MANQKHSAFDIYGQPFIRGQALVTATNLASLPSWTTATSFTELAAFNLTDLGLVEGDILIARWFVVFTTTAGSQVIQFRVGLDDGATTQYTTAMAFTSIGAEVHQFNIESVVHVVDDTASPTEVPTFVSLKADALRTSTAFQIGGGITQISTAAGNPVVGLNLEAAQTGGGDTITLWSSYCQLFGGGV